VSLFLPFSIDKITNDSPIPSPTKINLPTSTHTADAATSITNGNDENDEENNKISFISDTIDESYELNSENHIVEDKIPAKQLYS
jgi:hypothetical protein